MNWVPVTTNDVLAVLNSTELTTYQTFRPANGQADPLATLIGHVTSEVLGYVRRRIVPDASGNIPDVCLGHAVSIITWRLMLRCGSKTNLDSRKQLYDEAVKFLQDIAEGKIALARSSNPSTEITGLPQPAIARNRNPASRWKQDGI